MKMLVIFFCFVAACTPDHYETKGRITERKALPDSQLLIRYNYLVDGVVHTDSVILRNKVVNDDSVTVICTPGATTKSKLKLD